jgi:hypothetical protein
MSNDVINLWHFIRQGFGDTIESTIVDHPAGTAVYFRNEEDRSGIAKLFRKKFTDITLGKISLNSLVERRLMIETNGILFVAGCCLHQGGIQ